MVPPTSVDNTPGLEVSSNYLQVRLRIEPHPEAVCSVSDVDCREGDVRQSIVERKGEESPTCRADITTANGNQRFLDQSIESHCICPAFARHDCVASIENIIDNKLIVLVTVPDRGELKNIISDIRETGATPRLLQIVGSDISPENQLLNFEIGTLTKKQREAVRVAVESGYYETPREADLDDLANQLDISRSAVSQRLASVESKLISTLYNSAHGPS